MVRSGSRLVGMVLAGGIAAGPAPDRELFELDGEARARVVATLPKVAALLSRTAVRPTASPTPGQE
jgi:hypothetical protein